MERYTPVNTPVMLDLTDWYNGDGISDVAPFDGASLGYISGGVNTAFPANEMPEPDSVVQYGEAVFRFPSKEPGALNTLEPEGQTIPVPLGRYRRLLILGATLGMGYREAFTLATPGGR